MSRAAQLLVNQLAACDTHDSDWTRGWAVGYAQAHIVDRQSFEMSWLRDDLPTLSALLRGTGGQVHALRERQSRYTVRFVDVKVCFN